MRTALLLFSVALTALSAALLPGPRPTTAAGVAVAIAAGGGHTCALTSAGQMKCWGANSVGQLGEGTFAARRPTPVDVLDLGSAVAAIAAGSSHTCAVTAEGALKCWGSNNLGQLGDGTTTDRATPVDVIGLESGVAAVAAGTFHTCALTTQGGVKCWGRDSFGQLGADATEQCFVFKEPEPCSTAPLDVAGLGNAIADLAAGGNHSCAVTSAGGIKCWGDNASGALGVPTTDTCTIVGSSSPCSQTPVDVCNVYDEVAGRCTEVLSDITAVATGFGHTCALTTAGGVKCWGWNFDGELGDGGACLSKCPPTDVCQVYDQAGEQCTELFSGAVAVGVGSQHSCALTTAGGVKCWGDNLTYYQLGDGQRCGLECPTPVDVCSGFRSGCDSPLSNITAVSVGASHTCALTTDGAVKCWGKNVYGQVGTDCCNDRSAPVDVTGLGPKAVGDVDCSSHVNSVDAALVLQLDAALVASLPCIDSADVNGDTLVNSVDAALILQAVAGLITIP